MTPYDPSRPQNPESAGGRAPAGPPADEGAAIIDPPASPSGRRCANPACGQPLADDERFCQACGTPVAAESSRPWLWIAGLAWLLLAALAYVVLYSSAFTVGP